MFAKHRDRKKQQTHLSAREKWKTSAKDILFGGGEKEKERERETERESEFVQYLCLAEKERKRQQEKKTKYFLRIEFSQHHNS